MNENKLDEVMFAGMEMHNAPNLLENIIKQYKTDPPSAEVELSAALRIEVKDHKKLCYNATLEKIINKAEKRIVSINNHYIDKDAEDVLDDMLITMPELSEVESNIFKLTRNLIRSAK